MCLHFLCFWSLSDSKKRCFTYYFDGHINIKNKWYPVVRYDTVHGFAHKDILSDKGDVEKEILPFDDFSLALTFAEKDLKDNWQKYKERYLKGVEEND